MLVQKDRTAYEGYNAQKFNKIIQMAFFCIKYLTKGY